MNSVVNPKEALLAAVFVAAITSSSLLAQTAAGGAGPYAATPQRPTFTSDTSTTAPGTLEIESGFTFLENGYSLPLAFKFTPDVARGVLHQAEINLSFEGFTASTGLRTVRQFGDRLALAVRRPVFRRKSFSLAIAPQVTVLLRGATGVRFRFTGFGAYQFGRNSLVVNASVSGPTHSSPSNRRALDFASTFARPLGQSAFLKKASAFAGLLTTRTAGEASQLSLGQGVAYSIRPNWVFDLSIRQVGLVSGRRDHQALIGLTVNLGRIQRAY